MSKTLKPGAIVVTPGEILVNEATLMVDSPAIAAISIDCRSKRPRLLCSGSDENGPLVMLCRGDETLHADASTTHPTIISFPGYAGWEVFAAEVAKYTLSVCLWNRTKAG